MSATVAKEVFNQSYLAQTTDLASTTLVTSSVTNQLYRVSAYAEITSAGGNVTTNFKYTDNSSGGNPRTQTFFASPSLAANWIVFVVNVPNGNTLSVSTTHGGGTPTYNLFVIVEEM
jgi:hypothetical protein